MRQDMLQKISLQQGLTDRCEIQVSYAIGVAKPTSSKGKNIRDTNKISVKKKLMQLVDQLKILILHLLE